MSFIESMFSLEGKTVVITGGGGGIPGNLAIGFAKAGAAVVLWGRGTNHPMAEAARRVSEAAGVEGRVFAVTVDTASREACESAIAESEKLAGAAPDYPRQRGWWQQGQNTLCGHGRSSFQGNPLTSISWPVS